MKNLNITPNIKTYCSMLSALGASKKYEKFKSLWQEMKDVKDILSLIYVWKNNIELNDFAYNILINFTVKFDGIEVVSFWIYNF